VSNILWGYMDLSKEIPLGELIDKLQLAFTNPDVKTEVLDQEWLEKNLRSGIDSTGFCFAACQVIYKCNGKKDKWLVKVINRIKWEHGSHYYLQNKQTNEILDITKDQYVQKGISIPYELGKSVGIRGYSKGRILAKHIGIYFE